MPIIFWGISSIFGFASRWIMPKLFRPVLGFLVNAVSKNGFIGKVIRVLGLTALFEIVAGFSSTTKNVIYIVLALFSLFGVYKVYKLWRS